MSQKLENVKKLYLEGIGDGEMEVVNEYSGDHYTQHSTGVADGVETGTIRYDMTKEITQPWNMLIGAQWQINYRWQFRTEVQFLGSRTAAMLSLNYRFGFRGKNWLNGK